MTVTDEHRQFLAKVIVEAGGLLRERFEDLHEVRYKGEINLVTEADLLSEALIAERIRRSFPGHDILAEESPETKHGSCFRWIIDPLDGTTNYAHGYPIFCVSIALEVEGEILLGAVYNPMLKELFVAQKGEGASLNGIPISVSRTADLAKGLLGTGFPYDLRENRNNNMNYFKALAMSTQAIRRAGAAALDLAYLAAGRFDGFWELRPMPWDAAAGWLLVTEAGGVVTDLHGAPYGLHSPHILAGNGFLNEQMLAVIAKGDPFDRAD
ncbi:MAG: inositol monophosphatase [Proteobacteria bacterium]|nr:inositol monophosphatase [Pseudomonadota bacterium]